MTGEAQALTGRGLRAAPSRPAPQAASGPGRRAAWVLPLLVLAGLGLTYLLVNLRFPKIFEGELNIYLAQPATWLSLALLGAIGWLRSADRPKTALRWLGMGVLLGSFQVAVLAVAGLVFGFGRSPYGHQPGVLAANLLFAASVVVGVEFARACLLSSSPRARPILSIVLISVVMVISTVPLAGWGAIGDGGSLFRFAGGTLLPRLGESLLASVLAIVGGPLAAIAYRLVLQAGEWGPTILPNLPWGAAAFVGTAAPALGLLAVQDHLRGVEASVRPSRDRSSGVSRWLVPTLLLVVLLWLNLGLFGIQPTVVSGVSMEPALRAGDIVVTRQVASPEVLVGDIVLVRTEGAVLIHRVVAVRGTAEGRSFITRGDANNVEDAPIPASAVQGKVVLIVPKLGWVTIGARQALEWVRSLVPA